MQLPDICMVAQDFRYDSRGNRNCIRFAVLDLFVSLTVVANITHNVYNHFADGCSEFSKQTCKHDINKIGATQIMVKQYTREV